MVYEMMFFILTKIRFSGSTVFGIFFILYLCDATRISITRPGDSLDVFKQESSSCKDSWCSARNSYIYKSSPSSCACRCGFNSSTFVYKGDLTSSSCVENVLLRSSLGQCKLLLGSNGPDSPLSVLNLSTSGSEVVSGLSGRTACNVTREEFLDNGTWFTGATLNHTTFASHKNKQIKWSSTLDSRYAGHIVRVHFKCDVGQLCVIFKVQGTLSYKVTNTPHLPVDSSSVISLQPSPTSSYSRIAQITSSVWRMNTTNAKAIIQLDSATISPTLTTIVMVTTSMVVIGGTKAVTCARGAGVFCQWFYLVATAAGTLILVFVAIIAIFCACKRQRRRISNTGQHKQQAAVFFKSGLSQERDSSTELALIEDAKPVNEDHKGQNSEETFYQNVPRREKLDKNQLYRPLRSSDGQDSPTSPSYPGRFSYGSSPNDEALYEDTLDSKQLIKPEPGTKSTKPAKLSENICQSPNVHSTGIPSEEAVLDITEEEEATYEIMESKSIPRRGREESAVEQRNNQDVEVCGIENQVYEEDEKRQSHYEMIPMEEQSHYENTNTKEGLKSEPCGESLHHEQMDRNYSDFDEEEQTNYETMGNVGGEEQPNYETMDHSRKPSQQISVSDHDSEKIKEMQEQQAYDVPEITEDEKDYDIPEISKEFQEEQDECDYHYALNTSQSALNGPSDTTPDDTYIYANVPETQAEELREKLRNSWHPEEQRGGETNTLGSKVSVDKEMEKRPTSWNDTLAVNKDKNTTREEDSEELYSLPEEFPKPLPACLLKGKSSPQTNDLNQNQASPKLKKRRAKPNEVQQEFDQPKPKTTAIKQTREAYPGKTYPSGKTQGKTRGKSHPPAGSAKQETFTFDHPKRSKEGKASPKPKGKENSINKPHMSEDIASSQRSPRSRSYEKPARRRKQQQQNENKASGLLQKDNNKNIRTTSNEQIKQDSQSNEQPLYTNLVEMQNDALSLANENSEPIEDIDQQPLYENIGVI